MSVEFTVLASGSRGNSAIVRASGRGTMIDLGLGVREAARRMHEVGANWTDIACALLTHTHGDHVCDAALRLLAKNQIPLYCHEGHLSALSRFSGFQALEAQACVRVFDEHPFLLPNGTRAEPITLSHDGGPTFGFRLEVRASRRSRTVSVGYVADTGCWRRNTAECLMDVDILAVEFNHDVEMQKSSGRSPHLIARNLGPRGHLSNEQGAELLSTVLEESRPRTVRHVVLLHLSEECNRPDLAHSVARTAAKSAGRAVKIHVASQSAPFPHLPIAPAAARRRASTVPVWEMCAKASQAAPFQLFAD